MPSALPPSTSALDDSSPTQRAPSNARLVLAAFACLAGAASFACFSSPPVALLLPAGLLVASAGLIFRGELASHVFARAVLWSNLLLGFLIGLSGHGEEQLVGAAIALCTGAALQLVGAAGLRAQSDTFAPVAYRSALVLTIVMALADTQSLALFGALQLDRNPADAAPLLACAALMATALVGLYRLRLWGLLLNLGANLLIAALALTRVLDVPTPLVYALCSTAVIQLLLPTPLVVAMIRGGAHEPSTALQRARAVVAPALITVMMALVVYAASFDVQLIPMH